MWWYYSMSKHFDIANHTTCYAFHDWSLAIFARFTVSSFSSVASQEVPFFFMSNDLGLFISHALSLVSLTVSPHSTLSLIGHIERLIMKCGEIQSNADSSAFFAYISSFDSSQFCLFFLHIEWRWNKESWTVWAIRSLSLYFPYYHAMSSGRDSIAIEVRWTIAWLSR